MKSLVSWCTKCRDYMPVDSFAGATTYKRHTNNGATACPNSGARSHYKVYDSFAGGRISKTDRAGHE